MSVDPDNPTVAALRKALADAGWELSVELDLGRVRVNGEEGEVGWAIFPDGTLCQVTIPTEPAENG